jgi:hypothetical protein
MLPGYQSQSGTVAGADARSQAITDTATQPKLCPDPSPDQPGARPKDIEYQQYISMLVNGRVLPPGPQLIWSIQSRATLCTLMIAS